MNFNFDLDQRNYIKKKESFDLEYKQSFQGVNNLIKYAKKMSRRRSKTVEPIIGSLVNFINTKRVNTRGIKNSNKHVLMASLTYNLKKNLRSTIKKPSVLAQVISLKQGKCFTFVKTVYQDFIISNLSTRNFRILNYI